VHSFHKDVTEQDRANYDEPLDADNDANDFVSQKMLVRRETQWASQYFSTGIWTREITGVASAPTSTQAIKWDLATSNPITDIKNESVRMAGLTGYKPNTLVLSPYVYNALSNHEDILDRIKYTQKGIV